MTASTNTAATEAPAKRKPGRPKKVQEAETAVDFKTLAAETRAKMGGAKTLLADIAEIQAAPPEAADVLVPGDTAISVQNSITVSDLALGTLGLHEVPLSQTTRSSCNVRSHYDPAAIEELAASLAAQGQQQNATGRWNAEGQIEIVAGESRRRAQLLRMERGEITYGHPFLVRISEMTDGEALAASATENMRRRSMTALEECEAMQRL